MTTIVYRAGVLAVDSQACSGWTRDGVSVKGRKVGRILAAASGGSPHCQAFLDWASTGTQGLPDMGSSEKDGEHAFGYLFLPSGECVRFHPRVPPMISAGPFWSFGSGGFIALGALAVGATAIEAVEAAIRWDIGSGGPVRSWRHD